MIAAIPLYLSRLVPDLRSRRARWLLGQPNRLYGVLLEAFHQDALAHHRGASSAERERGLLYRIEPATPTAPQCLLVQSTEEPDWTRMDAAGERFLAPGRQPEWKAFSPEFAPGDLLRFRLRANPTKSVPSEEVVGGKRPRGKVIPIVDEPAQDAWLTRKLEGAARVEDLRIIPEGKRPVRPTAGGGAPLHSILFDGHLTVENSEALGRLLASGIGRGRAFGFGLLSVARG